MTAYVLPLSLIVALYSVMLYRLWNQAPGGRASAESIKNKKRVIRMVLIVVVTFAISWLPIHVILVTKATGSYAITPVSITAQIAAHILAYSNSCVNPILYAFFSEPFRRGFGAIVTCVSPKGPHGHNGNGYEMAEDARRRQNNKKNNNNNGKPAVVATVMAEDGKGGQQQQQQQQQQRRPLAPSIAGEPVGIPTVVDRNGESSKLVPGGDRV